MESTPSESMYDLSEMPEEMLVRICSEMDNVSLAKFLETSSENNRICGKVLEDRKKRYQALIDKIINELVSSKTRGVKRIQLESTDTHREFFVIYQPIDKDFRIHEIYHFPVLATQKLGWVEEPVSGFSYLSNQKLAALLLDLFFNGYLTGNYQR